MNFPSTNQSDANDHEFEVTLDEAIEPASASPAKPATAVPLSFRIVVASQFRRA